MDDPDDLIATALSTTEMPDAAKRLVCACALWAVAGFAGARALSGGWWAIGVAVLTGLAVYTLIRAAGSIGRLGEAIVLARRQAGR